MTGEKEWEKNKYQWRWRNWKWIEVEEGEIDFTLPTLYLLSSVLTANSPRKKTIKCGFRFKNKMSRYYRDESCLRFPIPIQIRFSLTTPILYFTYFGQNGKSPPLLPYFMLLGLKNCSNYSFLFLILISFLNYNNNWLLKNKNSDVLYMY